MASADPLAVPSLLIVADIASVSGMEPLLLLTKCALQQPKTCRVPMPTCGGKGL